MTAKEYLSQARFLDMCIDAHIAELEDLRCMSTRIQGCNFEEHYAGTRNTDPPFVKLIEKIMLMQDRINAEIDRLVDLKAEMDVAIEAVANVEERLLLRYRYLNNLTWEEISVRLHMSERSVRRLHGSALQNFLVPNES